MDNWHRLLKGRSQQRQGIMDVAIISNHKNAA